MTSQYSPDERAQGVSLGQRTYGLTPLQEGMLYQHFSLPGSGVDIEQVICTLTGPVDLGHLVHAWQEVADRHVALRGSFQRLTSGDFVQCSPSQCESGSGKSTGAAWTTSNSRSGLRHS